MKLFKYLGLAFLSVILISSTAYASVPTSTNGLIYGCRLSGGDVKVIDYQAGKRCPLGWTLFSWNYKGVKGDRGLTGLTGAQGPAGPALSVHEVNRSTTLSSTSWYVLTVSCPAGQKVIGGGGYVAANGTNAPAILLASSQPDDQGYPPPYTAWKISAYSLGAQSQPASASVYAFCTDI